MKSSNAETNHQHTRIVSNLPILWPTGVENGFPSRYSIVSPSENIIVLAWAGPATFTEWKRRRF